MKPIRPFIWLGLAAAIAARAAEPASVTAEPPTAPHATPATPVAKTPEPGTDLREIDKPRNTILRLPDFVMQEQKLRKVPEIKEVDLMTPKAKVQAIYQKHPGLHFGNLPFFSNDGIAYAMYEEEKRQEEKRQYYDLVSLLPAGPQAKKAKAIVDEQFSRSDFGSSH